MSKTILRLSLFFISGHLLLGIILLGIAATHGINDQDASFAVAMLFRCLNLPVVWAVGHVGNSLESQIVLILVGGIVQWAGVALAIAAVYHAIRSGFRIVAGPPTKTSQPKSPPDA